jgi:preprotein translocase subunit SecE
MLMKQFVEKIKNFFRGILEFLQETRKELNNVSWPTRRELTGTTLVVIVAVFFFGFYLWAVDLPANYLVHSILQLLSR